MKIGLNTYSFRKEIEQLKTLSLEQIWKIVNKIKIIEGIELLDRHIPGWPNGDLNHGIAEVVEQTKAYKLNLYALGPHIKMYQMNELKRKKKCDEYIKWIDFAADNGITQIRSQVGGPFGFFAKRRLKHGIEIVKKLLDTVLPYAEKRHVKIGIETHWGYSSWPPFLKRITEIFEQSPSLGIIFDWGNFYSNIERYEALQIATKNHNHVYNHVKIFNFGENFQEIDYDSYRIVNEFAQNNFEGFFSIEFEGKQPTLEGIWKSAQALKYAISQKNYPIDTQFDWKSLIN
jgi:sugar phosphate isomerase/epimerase